MKICVPIKKKRLADILIRLKKAQKKADLVEIWFDEINPTEHGSLEKIFKTATCPLIYKYQGNHDLLTKILPHRPAYIDLDLAVPPAILRLIRKKSPTTKIIISYHDFKTTPPDKTIQTITKKMLKLRPDIMKIATTANIFFDSLRMLSLVSQTAKKNQPIIGLCMGRLGQITRSSGHLFGNYLTYAALSPNDATAPGQLTLAKLHKICHSK